MTIETAVTGGMSVLIAIVFRCFVALVKKYRPDPVFTEPDYLEERQKEHAAQLHEWDIVFEAATGKLMRYHFNPNLEAEEQLAREQYFRQQAAMQNQALDMNAYLQAMMQDQQHRQGLLGSQMLQGNPYAGGALGPQSQQFNVGPQLGSGLGGPPGIESLLKKLLS